jgi:ribulose-5-phosphate 4-epimerase/fuculose-1-phosphate aldolase
VVAGQELEATVNAMEELEEGAKLAMMTRGMDMIGLSPSDVEALRLKYPS